ncbi:MAG: GTP 3',8-cyclase MoaA [Solirubrobacteraceae bacterium]|nr:GTP 3',8-cyclase MoaA [Solirubrobacteraceae bacterium]
MREVLRSADSIPTSVVDPIAGEFDALSPAYDVISAARTGQPAGAIAGGPVRALQVRAVPPAPLPMAQAGALVPSPSSVDGTLPLADRFGRVASDIRISLTDRCNLRCEYCMPAEGLPWQPREEHLTADEIIRISRVLVGLGIRTIRLTGGEPLLRKDLPEIIAALHAIPELEDVALTTNGVLLERQAAAIAAAGGARLNVSLDSADPEEFKAITRRDDLDRVLAGLVEARRHPELRPIKINAVALKGVTEGALDGLLAVASSVDAELRFIEPMPLDADRAWTPDDGLSGAQLRDLLAQRGELRPVETAKSATAQRYELGPGGQVVGFISSVTEPFCASCDRLRLTADGQLRSCLFSHDETDLRTALRAGASADELEALIRGAVWAKPQGHGMNEPGFEPPDRPMSAIGG